MQNLRFPDTPECMGLGLGMDLPWGMADGFRVSESGVPNISPRLRCFLNEHEGVFNYFFLAFQPRSFNTLSLDEYEAAYRELFATRGMPQLRAFHHTLLNLAALEPYNREAIYEFTNEIVECFDFRWINEDLGIWSINGKSLPYPIPPVHTLEGLEVTARNVQEASRNIRVPVCIEFPGFTEGFSFHIGHFDAFDFFREVAQQANVPVVMDVGHILSYQWIRGRQQNIFEDLDRLPLDRCFELHLSGCDIHNGKFRDLHHGILLDEQLDMTAWLLERCPNLRAVTYEDPRFDYNGELVPLARSNFLRLQSMVESWCNDRLVHNH